MKLKEKSAARPLKHDANSSIDAALPCQHTSFTPTAFLFNAFHSPNHTALLKSSGTHTYSRLHIHSSIHTFACWCRDLAGRLEQSQCACVIGICAGQSKQARGTCDSRSSQSSNCRAATFRSADDERTDRRTDTHKKINRRGDDLIVKMFAF